MMPMHWLKVTPIRIVGLLAWVCWFVQVRPALAEPFDPLFDPLAAAEQAYRNVDFETQRSAAQRALESGDNDPDRLIRIYRLLGIANASLEDREAAKLAFLSLLALDPQVELERSLSPRLRAPYMEARGFWDVAGSRLGVEVTGGRPSHSVVLRLHDPLLMVARVRVRSMDRQPATVLESEPAVELHLTSEELAGYWDRNLRVELLDKYNNILVMQALPRLAKPFPNGSATRPSAGTPLPVSRSAAPEFDYPSTILVGAGVLGLGIGAVAHAMREESAREWNGGACERSGSGTRLEQCEDVDQDRTTAERVAIFSYSAGGALLIAGVIMYLIPGSLGDEQRGANAQNLACGSGPGTVGIGCSSAW